MASMIAVKSEMIKCDSDVLRCIVMFRLDRFFQTLDVQKGYPGSIQERVLYGQCTVSVQFKTDSLV